METRDWPRDVGAPPANGSADKGKPTIHPAAFFVGMSALAAVPAGLIGLIWTADWRWLVTGLLVMLTLLLISASLNGALNKAYRA